MSAAQTDTGKERIDSIFLKAGSNSMSPLNLRVAPEGPVVFDNHRVSAIASTVTQSGCRDSSGRIRFVEDSFHLNNNWISNTKDGNILIPGWRFLSSIPYRQIGYLIKCKPNGDTLWVKNIASSQTNTIYYSDAHEFEDGTILLVGKINVPVSFNSRYDLVLTKLTSTGAFLWQRTFVTRFPNPNVINPYIDVYDLKSSPDGTIFLCGGMIDGGFSRFGFVAKFAADGTVMWSKGIARGGFIEFVGLNLVGNELQAYGSATDNIMLMASFNILTGDTVMTRKWIVPPGPNSYWRNFRPFETTKLNNGNTVLSGRCVTDVYSPDPDSVGHVGVLEISPSFTVVDAYRVMNKRQLASYDATRIKVYENGSAAFSNIYGIGGPQLHIGKIVNGSITKERSISYSGQSLGWTSNFLPLADGGDVIAVKAGETYFNSGIELFRFHDSDTSGGCLGNDIEKSFIVHQPYLPTQVLLDTVVPNMITEVFIHNNYLPYNDGLTIQNLCQQISYCDSLKLMPSANSFCLPSSLSVQIYKNKECGAGIEWVYDTALIKKPVYLNDSVVQISFIRDFQGYIKGRINGCRIVEDSIYVTATNSQPPTDLGADRPLCAGNTIILNARKGYGSYLWQDGSTDSTFTVTQPGLYYVTTTDACGGVFKDSVTITDAPPIPFDAGPDRNKCNSDTLQLSAPAGFLNYTWSNSYNISSTTSQTVIANPLVDTSYYVKAEKTTGCFAYDTIRVTVNQSPPINLGLDKSFCLGDSALFTAGSGFQTYGWSNGETTPLIVVKTAGQFSVFGTTVEGCKSSDTVKVLNVYPLPAVSLDKTPAICLGTSKTLNAGSFSSYKWNTGATTPTLSVNAIGVYAVTVTDVNSCKGTDTTAITTFYPLPAGFLPIDTSICSYGSLQLRPTTSYNTYVWSTGAITPSLVVTQPGLYWLQVRDNNTCVGRDSIAVNPKDCLKGFYAPSAFTPNGDNRNDVFRPLLFGPVKKYAFTVYNRWGAAVFQTKELQKGWDGKVAGVPQQNNTFVWTCTYQFEGEAVKTEKGSVTVIR